MSDLVSLGHRVLCLVGCGGLRLETVLGGKIVIFASEMRVIANMAYLWDAKTGKVSLGLADDCSCAARVS